MVSSAAKNFTLFSKRGLPVEDKIVQFSETFECTSADMTVRQLYLYILYLASTANPMPSNQHPLTPEEGKLVCPDGRSGSFLPALERRIALSVSPQLPLKRPPEDPDDEAGRNQHDGAAISTCEASRNKLRQHVVSSPLAA